MPEHSLADKVALVTGGNRGLGREMVLTFAAAGADVVIASRQFDGCIELADEVKNTHGRSIAGSVQCQRSVPVRCTGRCGLAGRDHRRGTAFRDRRLGVLHRGQPGPGQRLAMKALTYQGPHQISYTEVPIGLCSIQYEPPALLPLTAAGRIRPEAVVTHRFPISDGAHAYRMFADRADGVSKVVSDPRK